MMSLLLACLTKRCLPNKPNLQVPLKNPHKIVIFLGKNQEKQHIFFFISKLKQLLCHFTVKDNKSSVFFFNLCKG